MFHRAGCGVERNVRQKLAVRGRVVVHAHPGAPRRASSVDVRIKMSVSLFSLTVSSVYTR